VAIRATAALIADRSVSQLVVTREGLPPGYEIFAGNTHDSTTVEEIVETMEKSYGSRQVSND
jgi:transposase